MKKRFITIIIIFLVVVAALFLFMKNKNFVFCPEEVSYYGRTYNVIKIENQCWMKENLMTEKYSNGQEIKIVDGNQEWSSIDYPVYSSIPIEKIIANTVKKEPTGCEVIEVPGSDQPPSFTSEEFREGDEILQKEEIAPSENKIYDEDVCDCVKEGNIEKISENFGYLYNFYAIENNTLCPDGWMVASNEDWDLLEKNIISSFFAEKDILEKKKEILGSILAGKKIFWSDGKLKENPYFGFSEMDISPAGYRDAVGGFYEQGNAAYFWSLSDTENTKVIREINSDSTKFQTKNFQSFYGGASVRCVNSGSVVIKNNPLSTIVNYLKSIFIHKNKEKISIEPEKKVSETSNTFVACSNDFQDKRDQKVYKTLQVGNQCWMKENLDFEEEDGSVCEHDDRNIYGCYYNFKSSQNVCPDGWRLPSDGDWQILEAELGMAVNELEDIFWRYSGEIGNKLKAENYWENANNCNNCNSSGFSALPAGSPLEEGDIWRNKESAFFWTSTELKGERDLKVLRRLDYDDVGIAREVQAADSFFSVRCIKN